ncbi:MAG: hypothetical protein P8047_17600, partial [Gammaproteobacteria bacterium]
MNSWRVLLRKGIPFLLLTVSVGMPKYLAESQFGEQMRIGSSDSSIAHNENIVTQPQSLNYLVNDVTRRS